MKEYDEFFKMLNQDKSPLTIRSYKKDVDKFIAYFKVEKVETIDGLSPNDYREFIYSLGDLKPNSINGAIRNVSVFINWLLENEYITNDAFHKVKFGKRRFVKVPETKSWYLNDKECEDLINAGRNKQEKVMLAIMIFTGLRRQEICDIKLDNIRFDEENNCGVIEVFGKGSRHRLAYIRKDLLAMVNDYIETERDCETEYLFYGTRHDGPRKKLSGNSVNDRVKKCAELAGIDSEKLEKMSAHKTRHTFASNGIKEVGFLETSKAMGHSNLNTTRKYDNTGNELIAKVMLNQRNLNIFKKDES